MNADQLEILCKGLEDAITGLETMIQFSKTQADRIAELEQAIKDADEWLESGEGVSLCYYAFLNANPKSIKIIKEITG